MLRGELGVLFVAAFPLPASLFDGEPHTTSEFRANGADFTLMPFRAQLHALFKLLLPLFEVGPELGLLRIEPYLLSLGPGFKSSLPLQQELHCSFEIHSTLIIGQAT